MSPVTTTRDGIFHCCSIRFSCRYEWTSDQSFPLKIQRIPPKILDLWYASTELRTNVLNQQEQLLYRVIFILIISFLLQVSSSSNCTRWIWLATRLFDYWSSSETDAETRHKRTGISNIGTDVKYKSPLQELIDLSDILLMIFAEIFRDLEQGDSFVAIIKQVFIQILQKGCWIRMLLQILHLSSTPLLFSRFSLLEVEIQRIIVIRIFRFTSKLEFFENLIIQIRMTVWETWRRKS